MMPPTSIDGTDITGATIDGTDVEEITVDGDTVFSAGATLPSGIPDISNIHAGYDAIQQQEQNNTIVTSLTDLVGGFGDLSGEATYVSNSINGNPAFVHDGSNDGFSSTSLSSNLSAPQTIYIVCNLDNTSGTYNAIGFSSDSFGNHSYRTRKDGGDFDSALNGGNEIVMPVKTRIQTNMVIGIKFANNGIIKRDDGQTDTGNLNLTTIDKFHIGTTEESVSDSTNVGQSLWEGPIGAVYIYDAGHSDSTMGSVINFLSTRFGI